MLKEKEGKPNSNANDASSAAKDPQIEIYRIKKAFWLAIYGLLLAAILVFLLLLFGVKQSADIVAIVGLFTSVLGTLVGAFFGLQIGSAGKEKTEERADKADADKSALLGVVTTKQIEKAKNLFPEAFKERD